MAPQLRSSVPKTVTCPPGPRQTSAWQALGRAQQGDTTGEEERENDAK